MAVERASREAGAAEPKIKKGFDRQILKEYVDVFKGSQRCPDHQSQRCPDHQIWRDLCRQLELADATLRRYLIGRDKNDREVISLLDGQVDRYEPGLDEIFRYLAATDQSVAFPRGRAIVNRVVARALIGIRRVHTGQIHQLTPPEVERLRFLRHWNYQDGNFLGVARSGKFPVDVVHAMGKSAMCDLMGPLEYSDRFVDGLNRLWRDWNREMTELIYLLSYKWLR